jgi:hypothetical protein
MERKYNLVELNTAVKPFYMEYLYRRDSAVSGVIYLDPDIQVFARFNKVEEKLSTFNMIVTPHSCTFDDKPMNMFYETAMLSTGVYNLGFIATSRTETTFSFLQWWQKRLRDYCYYRSGTGLFVDQIWVTLAPLYFPGFYIERDPGHNMCYWNHFERRLSRKNGRYIVNGEYDLVFYHFSSFDPRHPEVIARRPGMPIFSFADRPDLKSIYEEYAKRLLAEDFLSIRELPCTFGQNPATPPAPPAATVIRDALGAILSTLPKAVQMPIRSISRLARKGGPRFPIGRGRNF